jgi:hypothetical protein
MTLSRVIQGVQGMTWRDSVKTLIGFALGTFLSLGAVTSASAAGTNAAAPTPAPPPGIEVIVVTAKRPAAQPIDAGEAIEEFVVTAKRVVNTPGRTPPVMAVEMPSFEFVLVEPVIRL